MTEPKLTIKPNQYQGWKLEYNGRGGDHAYSAEHDGVRLYAAELPELLERIRDTERVLVRLKVPLAVMYQPSVIDRYDRGGAEWRKASIYLLDGDTFYLRDEFGHTHHYNLNQLDNELNEPEHQRHPIVSMTAENRAIERKAERMRARATQMLSDASRLLRTMTPCTAGDIRLAAKGGAQ